MPFYAYACRQSHNWEVIKRIADIDAPEKCPTCGSAGDRQVTLPSGAIGASDWNTQTFNPGLGCYTRSNRHGEQLARERGLEPIGNEKPETIHAAMEKTRTERETRRWADADRDMLYE